MGLILYGSCELSTLAGSSDIYIPSVLNDTECIFTHAPGVPEGEPLAC